MARAHQWVPPLNNSRAPPMAARCQALPGTHLSGTQPQLSGGTSNPGRPARAVSHPTLNLRKQRLRHRPNLTKTPVWVSHATRTCRKAAPFTDVMSTMENNNMALSKRPRNIPTPNETVCASIAAARAPHTLPCTIDDKTCQQSSRYPVRRAALFPPRSRGRTWGWEGGGVAVGRGRV
eukprot:scaffold6196_cov113-Isochrysis_galbana.AAC.8